MNTPSATYARHRTSSRKRTTIQAPHHPVLPASNRLMRGEASRSSRRGETPAQNSIANRIPPNTIALPRSGWAMTRRMGTATRRQG